VTRPVFLALEEVLALHADQIRRYGGRGGIRDLELLKSALGMPEASYGGAYLHPSLAEMAGAYLFHVVRNHPFVDGNKRAGLIAALAFLGLNGLKLDAEADALFDLVHGVAAGTVAKAEVAVFLQDHARPRGRSG
jgi:death-on-curing protein